MKFSFFSSAIRPYLWPALIDSLKDNKYEFEIVFAGIIDEEMSKKFPQIRYVKTGDIKIAQAYEVARRECKGELICWMDDDHTFSPGFVDKCYNFFKYLDNSRAIIAVDFEEKGAPETLNDYRFLARNLNTPQMPLVGVMSREYLELLGGIDSRYIMARWNCDIAMRTIADGGEIVPYLGAKATLDSKNKNGLYNEFWSGWNEDSEQLENSWVKGGYRRFADPLLVRNQNEAPYWYIPISNREVTFKRNDAFSPFRSKDLLTISQPPVGTWFSKWG